MHWLPDSDFLIQDATTSTWERNLTDIKPLRLGTRGSQLALWQSNWVKHQLANRGYQVELVILKTTGDVVSGPLSLMGGQGVFTKRLQDAVLTGEVDFAVHSFKDVPTDTDPALKIAAVPIREDPRDVLVSRRYDSFDSLPTGAIVGTGSVRRQSQLLFRRSDLVITDIRGNLDTRLQKVDSGEYDAIVLAKAGLSRLGWTDRIAQVFEIDEMYPAIGQGALGIETRYDDEATNTAIVCLNDKTSFACVMAERKMLSTLQGGCLSPIGAATTVEKNRIVLTGVVLSRNGSERIVEVGSGPLENWLEIGASVANKLIEAGANDLP